MKIEKVLIQGLDKEITFIIGKNKSENFEVIDMGGENDLWFHANDISSCHVVCLLSDPDIDKKDLRYIIKTGALLCKNNTNKLKSMKNVEIIYTQIKNITKTDIEGCVLTQNTKSIVC
jgi:predicted ribosome quality control (RQC) complex YloA/Tae2 family protein